MRYLVVGGSTFIIDLGILYVLHGLLNLNLAASASIAYWVSISYNFTLNRYWTFDAREREDLLRHIATYIAILVVNYLFTVSFVAIVGLHMNYLAAKALSVIITMIWTYFVYKRLIFVSK